MTIDDWLTKVGQYALFSAVLVGGVWASQLNYSAPVHKVGSAKIGQDNIVKAGQTVVAEIPYELDTTRSCNVEIKLSIRDAANVQSASSYVLSATPQMFKESYANTPGRFLFRVPVDPGTAPGQAVLAGSANYSCDDNPLQTIFPAKLPYQSTFWIAPK